MEGIFHATKGFASSIWFPFMVGAMSGINIFTLVLSAPTGQEMTFADQF
jgi:hypothetical protein